MNLSRLKFISAFLPIFFLVIVGMRFAFIDNNHKLQTCEYLETAFNESSDLAPAWYENAGILLEECGKDNARLEGKYKSCMASRTSNTDINCDAEHTAAYPWMPKDK